MPRHCELSSPFLRSERASRAAANWARVLDFPRLAVPPNAEATLPSNSASNTLSHLLDLPARVRTAPRGGTGPHGRRAVERSARSPSRLSSAGRGMLEG